MWGSPTNPVVSQIIDRFDARMAASRWARRAVPLAAAVLLAVAGASGAITRASADTPRDTSPLVGDAVTIQPRTDAGEWFSAPVAQDERELEASIDPDPAADREACPVSGAVADMSDASGPFVVHGHDGIVSAYDHGSGESIPLTKPDEHCGVWRGSLLDDRTALVAGELGLERIDLRTGRGTLLIPGAFTSAVSPDGRTIAAAGFDYEAKELTVRLFDREDETGRALTVIPGEPLEACGLGEPNLILWSPDGAKILLVDYSIQGKNAYVLDPSDGAVLWRGEGGSIRWDGTADGLFVTRWTDTDGGVSRFVRLDLATGEETTLLTSRHGFGARAVSPDGEWVAFEETAPRPLVRLYNTRTDRVRTLGTDLAQPVWIDADSILALRVRECADCHDPIESQDAAVAIDLDGTTAEVRDVEWLWGASVWARPAPNPAEPLPSPEPTSEPPAESDVEPSGSPSAEPSPEPSQSDAFVPVS